MALRRSAACEKPSLWTRLLPRPCRLIWAAIPLIALAGPGVAAPLVGASADLARLPPKAQAEELVRLAENGVSTVRLPLDWDRVEPRPNQFAWKADDALVNAALARKLDVTLVLGPCASWAVHPAWDVPPQERRHSVPRSLDLWERYVRQAALHFRGRVRSWQIREHPNARNFRGARAEYLRLLVSAARVLRAADPQATVIVPEAGALDVAGFDDLCQGEARGSCDVLGLYLPASDPAGAALAWAVLRHEVIGQGPPPARPLWVLGADGVISADLWVQHYLLAAAFRADRFYLPAEAIARFWVAHLSDLRYLGFLRLGPEIWALVFEGDQGPVVAAWSSREVGVPASDLAPVRDPEALGRSAELGGAPGAIIAAGEGKTTIRLGPRPALLYGLDVDGLIRLGAPTRADVLAARPAPDPSFLPLVYADYSMPQYPELGLYNRPLRGLPGGQVQEVSRIGRPALQAHVLASGGEMDIGSPYVYFDLDDRWLYFARGKTRVAITVECEGSFMGPQQHGFNIMYDSTTGYRFTPWQWIDTGYVWHRYRVELDDVSFAGRGGFDFRINIQGSKQDIWIAAVTLEKLPGPAASVSGPESQDPP